MKWGKATDEGRRTAVTDRGARPMRRRTAEKDQKDDDVSAMMRIFYSETDGDDDGPFPLSFVPLPKIPEPRHDIKPVLKKMDQHCPETANKVRLWNTMLKRQVERIQRLEDRRYKAEVDINQATTQSMLTTSWAEWNKLTTQSDRATRRYKDIEKNMDSIMWTLPNEALKRSCQGEDLPCVDRWDRTRPDGWDPTVPVWSSLDWAALEEGLLRRSLVD